MKDIEGLRAEMHRVAERYRSGLQQRVCFGVSDRKVYMDLDRLLEDEGSAHARVRGNGNFRTVKV